jgi:prepilin-type N-terminal cleavage/methylation domain-containing protein
MKMNKKGFTIVELVIVIAVIAILAGVMIPTFGGVIDSANESSAKQEAQGIYKQVIIADPTLNSTDTVLYITVENDKYVFVVENAEMTLIEKESEDYEAYQSAIAGDSATHEAKTKINGAYDVPTDAKVYVEK